MTPEEFGERVRTVIPEAQIEEDLDGNLVVYTNYRIEDDTIVNEDGEEV